MFGFKRGKRALRNSIDDACNMSKDDIDEVIDLCNKDSKLPLPQRRVPMPECKTPKEECKYCHDYTQKVKEMSNNNAWFSLYEHYLEVADDRENGGVLSFKINNCPMCGRKLD
jgi:hypothetical protein